MTNVQFHAERCLVNLSPLSDCTACAAVCPEDAIRRSPNAKGAGDTVSLDTFRCTGCMRCLPDCPAEAFLPQPWPEVFTHPPRTLLLQCTGGEDPEARREGRLYFVSCLDVFGWWELLRLYISGVREVFYANDSCTMRPSGYQHRFPLAVAKLNQVLAAAGLKPLVAQKSSSDRLSSRTQRDHETSGLSRRLLLRGAFLKSAEAIVTPAVAPEDGQTTRAELLQELAQLSKTPHLSAYVIGIDSGQCYACHACFRLCPSGALRIESETLDGPGMQGTGESDAYYVLTPPLCIGCEVCQDVCDVNAIRVTWNPTEQGDTRLPLFSHRCEVCALEYPSLEGHETICWVCRILEERKKRSGTM
jgi:formate hydrogenlyase subunit 6/NADH:ubiquinone oxidoreductase subunit I